MRSLLRGRAGPAKSGVTDAGTVPKADNQKKNRMTPPELRLAS